jgi:hypothetical protein
MTATGTPSVGRSFWRDTLAPYARADRRRSLSFVLTSVLPYLALLRLKLYDQEGARMVSFAQARANSHAGRGPLVKRWTSDANSGGRASPRSSAAATTEGLGKSC